MVSMFLVSCSNKDNSKDTGDVGTIQDVGNPSVTLNVGDITEKLDEEKEKNSKLEKEVAQLKDELQKLKDTEYESADEALKAENEELKNQVQELEEKGVVAQSNTKEQTDMAMLPYDGKFYKNYDNTESNEFFTMSGEKFKEGFRLDCRGNDVAFVLFNLNNKYNKLIFDYGHIDETDFKDFTLTIKIDGEEVTELPLIPSTGITRNQEIPLNGGSILELRVSGTGQGDAFYGFTNLRFE